MSRDSRVRALSLALALLGSACAKPPTVIRGGVEITVDQASKLDFEAAESLYQKRQVTEATRRFQRVVSEFPQSSFADNAQYRLAQIERSKKNVRSAIDLLKALVGKYPTSDILNEAKEDLVKLYVANQEFGPAADIAGSVNLSAIPANRLSSFEQATRAAFDRSGNARGKFRFLISLYDSAAPNSSPPLQAEIIEYLDRELNSDDLRQIVEIRKDVFPADYAVFKLAKLSLHVGETAEARRWLAMFLNRYRNHEYATEAVILSEQLERREQADPAAIGFLLPLTGPNRPYAAQVLKGASLALGLFGSALPTPGDNVRLYVEDSGENAEEALAGLKRLLQDRRVIAVAGPLFASQSQAVAVEAGRYELPVVSFSAAENVTELGRTIFRNAVTKSLQAETLAALAFDKLGIRRAAILYPQNNYGTEFMTLFWENFVKRGGEIRGVESYDPELTNFGGLLKRLIGEEPSGVRPAGEPAQADFEALFIPDSIEKISQIAPALAYYNIRGVTLLGPNLWNSPDLFRGGDKGAYVQGAVFADGFFRERNDPLLARFAERFYSTFGEEPGLFEVQGFDTMTAFLSVLRSERPPTRSSFARALAATREVAGAIGPVGFDERREARRTLLVLTADDGRIVELQ